MEVILLPLCSAMEAARRSGLATNFRREPRALAAYLRSGPPANHMVKQERTYVRENRWNAASFSIGHLALLVGPRIRSSQRRRTNVLLLAFLSPSRSRATPG